ncbi:hypothetical protein CAY62_21190 (plasmid) [Photobacterium damselae subsp. damselae]|nr:hypothetical protein CAY62_21190 [Photobacterium damselae subsp. damselae]
MTYFKIERNLTNESDFIDEIQKIDSTEPESINVEFLTYQRPLYVSKVAAIKLSNDIMYVFYDIHNNEICKILKISCKG